jgi:hypothetical protein
MLYQLKEVTQKIAGVADVIMDWLDRGLVYLPDDADRVFIKQSRRWKIVYSKQYSRRWKIPVTVNTLDSDSCVVHVEDGAYLWDLNLAVRECMPIPCNANLEFYTNKNKLDLEQDFTEPCTLTMMVDKGHTWDAQRAYILPSSDGEAVKAAVPDQHVHVNEGGKAATCLQRMRLMMKVDSSCLLENG